MFILGWVWAVIGFPFHCLAKAYKWGAREMGIIKLRWRQSRNPSQFLRLIVDRVNFNPKAYLGKEQDYLELSLVIQSGLLVDLQFQRLVGSLSIDGSQPPETFEILNDLVIHRTGQDTEWNNIVVRLSCQIQQDLHLRREQGQDVMVSVQLTGHFGNKIITLWASTGKLRVPKLPRG